MFQTSSVFKVLRLASIVGGLALAALTPTVALSANRLAQANPPGSSVRVEPPATPAPTASASAESEFTGTLSAINGDVWMIGGVPVTVTGGTEINGDPQVGDVVKVHASPQADGAFVAREVEPAPTPVGTPAPGATAESEIVGAVSAINGSQWTVNGVIVTVGNGVEIKGNPVVGSVVKVEGALQADGSLQAREIKAQPLTGTPSGDDDSANHSGSGNSSDDHSGSSGDDDNGDDHSGGHDDDDDDDHGGGHDDDDDDDHGGDD